MVIIFSYREINFTHLVVPESYISNNVKFKKFKGSLSKSLNNYSSSLDFSESSFSCDLTEFFFLGLVLFTFLVSFEISSVKIDL